MESNSHYPEPLAEGKALYVLLNIRDPIETLKTILEQKTRKPLSTYTVWLQNDQTLEPHKSLVDLCVKGEGLVQVRVELDTLTESVNITDIVMPTEDGLKSLKPEANETSPDSDGAPKNQQNGNSNDSVTVNSVATPPTEGRTTGNNKQIHLWQFLLEILTDSEHKNIIQWIDGGDGEFKLTDPERVAALWGQCKKKPQMDYAKFSRALRFHYDGGIISKVGGKHFAYKFVCDLYKLTGYSAQVLADRFNGRLGSFDKIS